MNVQYKVFHFPPPLLFQTYLSPVHIWPARLQTAAETRVGLHVQCTLMYHHHVKIFSKTLQYQILIYDMIYLLTAIGLSPGGSSTVHIYTQTAHRTTQNTEQHKHFGRVWAVPRLGELYPVICPTTEEKARKNLSQGSASKNT